MDSIEFAPLETLILKNRDSFLLAHQPPRPCQQISNQSFLTYLGNLESQNSSKTLILS